MIKGRSNFATTFFCPYEYSLYEASFLFVNLFYVFSDDLNLGEGGPGHRLDSLDKV